MSKVININVYIWHHSRFYCAFYLKLRFKNRIKFEFIIEIRNSKGNKKKNIKEKTHYWAYSLSSAHLLHPGPVACLLLHSPARASPPPLHHVTLLPLTRGAQTSDFSSPQSWIWPQVVTTMRAWCNRLRPYKTTICDPLLDPKSQSEIVPP